MSALFISLGTSWAIVPEAFLHPAHAFTQVHVLTTAAEKINAGLEQIQSWFGERASGVQLTIHRVDEFSDLTCSADHERFEEALFRWYVDRRCGIRQPVQICVSGGFKTMSAAVQHAGEIFGCEGMFHVLCQGDPGDAEAIETARAEGRIRWIELGPRRGRPEFRDLKPHSYPLSLHSGGQGVAWIRSKPDPPLLRDRVAAALQRQHRISERWTRIGAFPFQSLALLPDADLEWLEKPLVSEEDGSWVRALPKIELHCHLGGFATHGEPLERVREAASDPAKLPDTPVPSLPELWPRPKEPLPLKDYMKLGNANGSRLLKDPGCLRAQVDLLYDHLREQGIVYAEIRCSPGNYADEGQGRSAWEVMSDLRGHFNRNMCQSRTQGKPACHVNLIVIATRRDAGDHRTAVSRHLSLAVTAAEHWRDPDGCRIVGVDLTGYEVPETRAHYYREEFAAAHRIGLAVTVHAGENDDAEAIWLAVFDLNARRIGHGLHLHESPELMRSMSDRRIGVEMCPFANYQIRGFAPMAESLPRYPLLDYLRDGVSVTVNTDNIGISQASISDNILFLCQLCPDIRRREILQLQRNALEMAFVPTDFRSELQVRMDAGLMGRAGKTTS